jgi:hypothetical protein
MALSRVGVLGDNGAGEGLIHPPPTWFTIRHMHLTVSERLTHHGNMDKLTTMYIDDVVTVAPPSAVTTQWRL